MLHEAFREDPEEFGANLQSAYESTDLGTVPHITQKKSFEQLSAPRRVEILRNLPSCERCMLTIRTMCLKHNGEVLKVLHGALLSGKKPLFATELLLNAAGYSSDDPDVSQIELVPRKERRNALMDNLGIVFGRATQLEYSVQDRIERTADRLIEIANIEAPDRHPSEHPLDMQRLLYNIRLMQTLALHGLRADTLEKCSGIARSVALGLTSKGQGNALRDVDTINDALRPLPIQSGQDLARRYLHLLQDRKEAFTRPTPSKIRSEAKSDKHRRARAKSDMLWRAIGAKAPLRSAQDTMPPERIALEKLIRELGLSEHVEAKTVWHNLCESLQEYDAVISGARPY